MAERERGKVKWFHSSKGYGFIERAKGKDVFVHYSNIRGDGESYRNLKEGEEVEFTVEETNKGPQAMDVIPV